MARYTPYDSAQTQRLPVPVARPLLPDPCEYPLHSLSDAKIDLSVCAARSRNEAGGAPADAPALLLQSIRCA
jgi:hypothetical protein